MTDHSSDARTVRNQLLLLTAADVRTLLTPEMAEGAVREAYTLLSSKAGSLLPLLRQKLDEGSAFGIKGGIVPEKRQLGFKAAGYWPQNQSTGIDKHQGTIVLIDYASGRPIAMMDGNLITTLRTGAAGGIGIDLLARPDAEVLAVIGTGVQGLVQAEFALRARPGIRAIRYLERRSALEEKFLERLQGKVRMIACQTADEVVSEADIVITATSSRIALFNDACIRAGTHINAVGTDTAGKREIPSDLIRRAKVFVDSIEQCRSIGELQWEKDIPSVEIGEVLRGRASGRNNTTDITVFDMTGIGLQDLICAERILQAARAAQTGQVISWPAG